MTDFIHSYVLEFVLGRKYCPSTRFFMLHGISIKMKDGLVNHEFFKMKKCDGCSNIQWNIIKGDCIGRSIVIEKCTCEETFTDGTASMVSGLVNATSGTDYGTDYERNPVAVWTTFRGRRVRYYCDCDPGWRDHCECYHDQLYDPDGLCSP